VKIGIRQGRFGLQSPTKFGNPASIITSGNFVLVFSLNPRFTERQVPA
jgi:hypothetical protein